MTNVVKHNLKPVNVAKVTQTVTYRTKTNFWVCQQTITSTKVLILSLSLLQPSLGF
jgi:hypothetical protein